MTKKYLLFLVLSTNIFFSQCYTSVKTSSSASIALKTDGSLWAWGYNSYGVLGNGTQTTNYTKTQIGVDTNWSSIFSITSHVVALKNDGTLWSWGNNNYGQCGNGTSGSQNYILTPQQIGTNIWIHVAAGNSYSLGIKSNGTLWSWGNNDYGQLGTGCTIVNGTVHTISSSVPVQVGNANNWAKVFSVNNNSFGIKTDGTLWSWGSDYDYVLGYVETSTGQYTSPHQIGTDTNWLLVSPCVAYKAMAIKSNGTLWSWGRNASSAYSIYYGNGYPDSNNYQNGPIQIGTDTDWKTISDCAQLYTIGVKNNGTLWAWGDNTNGILGDGTTITRYIPTQIGTDTDWESLFAFGINYAIKTNHSLYKWGNTNDENSNGGIISSPTLNGVSCLLDNISFDIDSIIELYPNPTNDFVEFSSSSFENTVVNIVITDQLGQIMYENKEFRINNYRGRLDFRLFSSGLYFIKILDKKKSSIIKVIKK